MEKTSKIHPLQIAELTLGRNMGRIGITFCPGKGVPSLFGGAWNRDLGTDLNVIRQWGASTVVSLIEDHEFKMLSVEDIGPSVRRHHMTWLHLPIQDVSIPDSRFEHAWDAVGETIRAILRAGFDIVIHCRGGLGRAGTIAARILVELGSAPADAIARVRDARQGAIETGEQEDYVYRQKVIPEFQPETTIEAIRDRAIGAMLGLAVGDAVGTTLEFSRRDSYPLLEDMVGGGPFKLARGQWTDDTAMALALAEALNQPKGFTQDGLMENFGRWYSDGAFSCTGDCFDIGHTTREAIDRWKATGFVEAGSSHPSTAGKGSLMRLAPVAVRFWNDRIRLRDIAAQQSKTTHAAPEAVDACVLWAEILADAISGKPRSLVLRSRNEAFAGAIATIASGSWRGRRRDTIKSGGYVVETLEASYWSIGRSGNFKDAILTAANLGGDADTTAAITGQLGGALNGRANIPVNFLKNLAWRDDITAAAKGLFLKSIASQ